MFGQSLLCCIVYILLEAVSSPTMLGGITNSKSDVGAVLTRNIREEYRRNLRTAQYLLESNLAIQDQEHISDCKKDEFENLLAFADCLIVLQDNADTCYFTDFDLSINIDSEYKVDTVLSEFSELQYEQMYKCLFNRYWDRNRHLDISLLEYLQLDVVEAYRFLVGCQ